MLIKPPQKFEVPSANPFANDVLERKGSADALSDLVSKIEEPFVLAIDSPFGTGKTTFVNMWKKSLENGGYHCLSFNAWENDFLEDPLAALIGVLQPQLGGHDTQKEKIKDVYEKTKKAGVALLKHAIPLGAKAATLGMMNVDKAYEDIVGAFSEQLAKDLINNYHKHIDAVTKFKEALAEYSKEVSVVKSGGKRRPTIIFIDELDRCRPTFAVELLERIKHFFDIPGFVFILSYDKKQLGSSFKTIYGHELDTDGYLRRFVDLEFQLPEPAVENFVKMLFKKYDLDDYFSKHSDKYAKENLVPLFTELFSTLKLSLRTQEHCFIQLSIVAHTTPHNKHLHPYLVALLIALKNSNSDLYYKFISKQISHKEVISYFKQQSGNNNWLDEHYDAVMEGILISCSASNEQIASYRKEYVTIAEDAEEKEKIRNHASTVIEVLDEPTAAARHTRSALTYIAQKLELLNRFHDFQKDG